jgi:hypothetical protein
MDAGKSCVLCDTVSASAGGAGSLVAASGLQTLLLAVGGILLAFALQLLVTWCFIRYQTASSANSPPPN